MIPLLSVGANKPITVNRYQYHTPSSRRCGCALPRANVPHPAFSIMACCGINASGVEIEALVDWCSHQRVFTFELTTRCKNMCPQRGHLGGQTTNLSQSTFLHTTCFFIENLVVQNMFFQAGGNKTLNNVCSYLTPEASHTARNNTHVHCLFLTTPRPKQTWHDLMPWPPNCNESIQPHHEESNAKFETVACKQKFGCNGGLPPHPNICHHLCCLSGVDKF